MTVETGKIKPGRKMTLDESSFSAITSQIISSRKACENSNKYLQMHKSPQIKDNVRRQYKTVEKVKYSQKRTNECQANHAMTTGKRKWHKSLLINEGDLCEER